MKNPNLLFTVLWSTIIIVWIHPHKLLAQNSSASILPIPENAVQIIDFGNYFQVTIDYTSGISHYDMGVELGKKILQVKPDYELLLDSYIDEMTHFLNISNYSLYISRVEDIKPQMNQAYQDEIDGIASQFSGGNVNKTGDNKVSKDELYLLQLLPEVIRGTQCSGISVYGERSETGYPITARLMDWTDGSKRQLAQIQAVTTIKYGNKSNCLIGYGSKSICMIGYLGHLTFLTGLNCDGVFAGILDSSTGAVYSSTDKYSYTSDLRYALENSATLDEVANYVTNPSRNYPFNHNVLLSDRQTSKVLENNFSGTGTNMQRALRSDTSALNPEITWGFTDAVATVNSFLLYGNHDNHTGNLSNMNRWESLKTQLQNYGETITLDELKLIASFDNDDGPGSQSSGDVYNKGTQQIVLFQPDNFHLEVAFRPKSGILPADPVFETILLVWNHLAYAHTLNMDKIAPITLNDTITISAFVENPKEHEVSALLIFESLDGAIVDSVEMFPVDPALNEPWQCKWITENIPENIYWLSLKVTDITEGTYFTSKNMTRVTNRPLTIGTLSYTKSSDNKYSIKTELKYPGESMKIISPIIKITSDDPWIKSIAPEQVTISGLKPGDMKRIPSSVVSLDEATFPGYLNLKYTIFENGWPLWVIDTITIFFVPTGLEQFESHLSFNLEQNYPNPFNSVTTINWQLAKTSKVTLKVLDIVGKTVATLVDEQRPQGKYETRFDAATLPKGIYFCQLKAGENMQTRKMILLD